ncbi:MAG: superoxide dismutase family protein [Novosphingobium sp.]
MLRSPLGLAPFAVLALAGCASLDDSNAAPLATATLVQVGGLPAGTALFSASGEGITLHLAAAGLTPGGHGLHLHAVGKCTGGGFTDAGAHLNPGARQHGTENPAGSHLGDLPNLVVGANGAGTLTARLPGLRRETEAALFDADGTALVIHAAFDDYRTDPTGNSGARVACGVIERR